MEMREHRMGHQCVNGNPEVSHESYRPVLSRAEKFVIDSPSEICENS